MERFCRIMETKSKGGEVDEQEQLEECILFYGITGCKR